MSRSVPSQSSQDGTRSGAVGNALGAIAGSTPTPGRPASAVAWVGAAAVLLLAAWTDAPHAIERTRMVGEAFAGDGTWTLPLGPALLSLSMLLPLGPLDARARLLLALPAAAAVWAMLLRLRRVPLAAPTIAVVMVRLALALIVGALLLRVGPEVSVPLVAMEFSLWLRHDEGGASKPAAALSPWEGTLWLLACWAAPWLALPAFVLVAKHARWQLWQSLAFATTLALPLLLWPLLRLWNAWCAVGTWAALPSAQRALEFDPAMLRAVAVPWLLAIVALLLRRRSERRERGLDVQFALAGWLAAVAGDRAGAIVATAAISSLALSALAALALAVRQHTPKADGRAAALTFLAPAIALGLAARALEVQIHAQRRPAVADAARAHALLATTGLVPTNGLLLIEDEQRLLWLASARVEQGFRPDLVLMPVQRLLRGGARHMAERELRMHPHAASLLRGLLTRGTLEAAELAEAAQYEHVFACLGGRRIVDLAAQVAATGDCLELRTEHLASSERRQQRTTVGRRWDALAEDLAALAPDDVARSELTTSVLRELRVMQRVGDREAVNAAMQRARMLLSEATVAAAASSSAD